MSETVVTGYAAVNASQLAATRRRAILSCAVGNFFELFDFTIYGYFAAQIGRQFFPHENAVTQLLSTFGVFAVGYLARPLGGVILGHVGDCFGRRAALTFSDTSTSDDGTERLSHCRPPGPTGRRRRPGPAPTTPARGRPQPARAGR